MVCTMCALIQKSRVSFRRISFLSSCSINRNNIFWWFIKWRHVRLLLHRKFYVKKRKVLIAYSGRFIRITVGKRALCIAGCGTWNLCHCCLCRTLNGAIYMKNRFLQTNFKTKLEDKCIYFNLRTPSFVDDFFLETARCAQKLNVGSSRLFCDTR